MTVRQAYHQGPSRIVNCPHCQRRFEIAFDASDGECPYCCQRFAMFTTQDGTRIAVRPAASPHGGRSPETGEQSNHDAARLRDDIGATLAAMERSIDSFEQQAKTYFANTRAMLMTLAARAGEAERARSSPPPRPAPQQPFRKG